MSSSSITKPLKKITKVTDVIIPGSRQVRKLTGKASRGVGSVLGLSEDNQNILQAIGEGAVSGSFTGGGTTPSILGALDAREANVRRKELAAAAQRSQDDKDRLTRNSSVINSLQNINRNLLTNTDVDLSTIQLEGSDPRQRAFTDLLNVSRSRQQSVLSRRTRPGQGQTRLV